MDTKLSKTISNIINLYWPNTLTDFQFCYWPKEYRNCFIVAPPSDCPALDKLPSDCIRAPRQQPITYNITLAPQRSVIPKSPKQYMFMQYKYIDCGETGKQGASEDTGFPGLWNQDVREFKMTF